jgi:hypothetical protein
MVPRFVQKRSVEHLVTNKNKEELIPQNYEALL